MKTQEVNPDRIVLSHLLGEIVSVFPPSCGKFRQLSAKVSEF